MAGRSGFPIIEAPKPQAQGQVALASASTPMTSGQGTGQANFADWMMHPARTMLRSYEQEHGGGLPGMPPPAASVTPAMAASQPPANLDTLLASLSGGNTTNINIATSNHGVMDPAAADKTIQGSVTDGTRWTPSMAPVIYS